jgi:pantoate--beta-alanine ligase
VDRPRLVHTRQELALARGALGDDVALVPTMGALHRGHAELLRQARARAQATVVSVFVNPLQFGEAADLDRYPRTLDADLAVCAAEGVDLVWAPGVEDMYPGGEPAVRVSAGALGEVLEGASRPGHFDGVLTVVAKLLLLTRPRLAVFGTKDAQQLALVRRMVRDLDLGVEVVGVPTVRESDGLALSSRNVHLSDEERAVALALSAALRAGEACGDEGAEAVRVAAGAVLDAEPACRVDYLELVDPDDFTPVPADHRGEALLTAAAWVGTTRLIDNVAVGVGTLPARRPG